MKPRTFLPLVIFAIAVFFQSCKTTEPSDPRTVEAPPSLSKTPQEWHDEMLRQYPGL